MIDTQRLHDFLAWWQQYCRGDEKGEAQIFLDRLFQALGHAGAMEAGGVFEDRIQRRTAARTTTAFADFVIPNRVIIEMKKRGEDLRQHYDQALNYWIDLAARRPPYVILCNFDELWIYDLNRQPREPMEKLKVADLAERPSPLAFLFAIPETPLFNNDRVAVTEEAAFTLSRVFQSLLRPIATRELTRAEAQRYTLQCMLALFAEDIGLLPNDLFTRLIEACQNGENSYDIITTLFYTMNRVGGARVGRYRGVAYFDGGLFSEIVAVDMTPDELRLMREAARHDWSKVHPGIFGTIFEQSMDSAERHRVGGHYTTETDILRIVIPVITRPWQDRLDAATTPDQLIALHAELCRYQVLDPACGSGNFLYVAYRALKSLEYNLFTRVHLLGRPDWQPAQFVNTRQLWGFDVEPFAVELAKVTLMVAKKLAVDEYALTEAVLPLDNLDANIRQQDALFTDWPAFDACIGNPPYLGAKRLKVEYGVEYVNRVRAAFPDVPGNADYCVYWFRKAHELMLPGARAGLVGTNTIRQNYSRIGGLDYIVAHDGHIFEAVSSMPWRNTEAKPHQGKIAVVHVSIACWQKIAPTATADLNTASPTADSLSPSATDIALRRDAIHGVRPDLLLPRLWIDNGEKVIDVPSINSSLSLKTDVSGAHVLKVNAKPKRVFVGQQTGHIKFVLTPNEMRAMLNRDPSSRKVIYPFLVGRDLTAMPSSKPSRYVIDMNDYDITEAVNFRDAFKHIERHILPFREQKVKQEVERNKSARAADDDAPLEHEYEGNLEQWWKHARGRSEDIKELQKLSRYIVCSRHTKRPIFDFVSVSIRPDSALVVFILDDDYSFGILQSNLHAEWFKEKASTIKSDYRYTPHSVFDTFPWPQTPNHAQVKAVALAARALHDYRREAMRKSERLTLRSMYRTMELPGKHPLKDLHAALDSAVLTAYGFDPSADLLAQLLALNHTVANSPSLRSGEGVGGVRFLGPGIPPSYPNPAELISTGCITPPEFF